MERDAKFGYAFLLVGTGLPYIIDKLLGPTWAVVCSLVLILGGVGFLYAGHRHGKALMPSSSIGKISVFLLAACAVASFVWAGNKYYRSNDSSTLVAKKRPVPSLLKSLPAPDKKTQQAVVDKKPTVVKPAQKGVPPATVTVSSQSGPATGTVNVGSGGFSNVGQQGGVINNAPNGIANSGSIGQATVINQMPTANIFAHYDDFNRPDGEEYKTTIVLQVSGASIATLVAAVKTDQADDLKSVQLNPWSGMWVENQQRLPDGTLWSSAPNVIGRYAVNIRTTKRVRLDIKFYCDGANCSVNTDGIVPK